MKAPKNLSLLCFRIALSGAVLTLLGATATVACLLFSPNLFLSLLLLTLLLLCLSILASTITILRES